MGEDELFTFMEYPYLAIVLELIHKLSYHNNTLRVLLWYVCYVLIYIVDGVLNLQFMTLGLKNLLGWLNLHYLSDKRLDCRAVTNDHKMRVLKITNVYFYFELHTHLELAEIPHHLFLRFHSNRATSTWRRKNAW